MSDAEFDVLVIGGGPGGYICAIKAAQLGSGSVACVDERERMGGTCLNVGCIPSKALLESSHYYAKARKGMEKHGVICGDVKFDMKAMMAQKDGAIATLGGGIDTLLKKNKITKIVGKASFVSRNAVRVATKDGEKVITAKKIVIATGSKITHLPNIQIDGKTVITSDEAISLPHPPKRLLVIGGGAIGLELGSVWSRLGSEVTVVEYMDRIAPTCDKEISSKLQGYLSAQGINFKLNTSVKTVDAKQGVVVLESAGSAESVAADCVVVCVGRRPNVEGLAIEIPGIKLDDRGRIVVNDKFLTSVDGIYAIGDVIPGPMLAHKAEKDGVAVAEIMTGRFGHVDYNLVPSVIYTSPEAGMIGKTEEQLKESGVAYKVGKSSFAANGRARVNLKFDGFVKVLTDAKTDEILGMHILHEMASELIATGVIGMNYRASSEDLSIPCYPHPTFSEAIMNACEEAH